MKIHYGAWCCAVVVGMSASLSAQSDLEFVYSVDAPAGAIGAPGEAAGYEATCFLEVVQVPGKLGPEGWSMSVAVEGGAVTDVTTEGTSARQLMDSEPGRGNFEKTELASMGGLQGAISAIILGFPTNDDPNFVTLAPEGRFDVLRLTVEAQVPPPVATPGEVCPETSSRLFFVDGLVGSGRAVSNRVTLDGASVQPTLTETVTRVAAVVANAGDDLLAEELAVVTLDGSGSTSGANPVYAWQQTSGTPVGDLSGADMAQLMFSAPLVDGEEGLDFQLTVTVGGCASTDSVRVTVTENPRTASMNALSTVELLDNNQALVFAADLGWDVATEDGVWEGVRFTAIGSGHEGELLDTAALHVDSNNNGVFDPGDAVVGAAVPVEVDNGELFFDLAAAPVPLTQGSLVRFFLVATVTQESTQAGVWPWVCLLVLGGLLTKGLRTFRGGRLSCGVGCVAAVLFVVLPSACSSGSSGGSSSAELSRQVQFEITGGDDVVLSGATSAAPGVLMDAPITGPALEV